MICVCLCVSLVSPIFSIATSTRCIASNPQVSSRRDWGSHMKSLLYFVTLVVAISISALTQESAPGQQTSSPPDSTPAERERNAASATEDNSGISGDQVTKPAGAKAATLIGCLSGPNAEGKYVLASMQHRSGVQVLGPDDLKNDSGTKVKLTGSWEASPEQQPQANAKKTRRFQVTAIEVLSQHCEAPSEKTPVSKEKQRQREMQQQQKKNSSSGDQASPK